MSFINTIGNCLIMLGFKKKHRNKLLNSSLSEDARNLIFRNVPYYSSLSTSHREKLEGLILLFIDEKPFEGCGGIKISEEIKLTVASQACILLLGDPKDYYPTLRSILVYPHFYYAKVKNQQPDGTVIEGFQGRIGESWSRGHIVLSWKDVMAGANDPHDATNVVFHEFAHLLDYENDVTVKTLRTDEKKLNTIITRQYNRFLHEINKGELSILNLYAATDIKEFFAVGTEYFFEHPAGLKASYPELYEALKLFYQQDPITYFDFKQL